jgi:hypothetical protein
MAVKATTTKKKKRGIPSRAKDGTVTLHLTAILSKQLDLIADYHNLSRSAVLRLAMLRLASDYQTKGPETITREDVRAVSLNQGRKRIY